MVLTIVITLLLIVVIVLFHYEALRSISRGMERLAGAPRNRLILVVGGVLVAHIVEILLFACGFVALDLFGLGDTDGTVSHWIGDAFYLSASSYTTLGMGDLYPVGPSRIMSSLESLVGLVMIGWSTSFTYLAMRDFWDLH